MQTPDGGLRDPLGSKLEAILDLPSHHTATALATTARKQHPLRVERARRELHGRSVPCVGVADILVRWATAAGNLELMPTPWDVRPMSVGASEVAKLSPSDRCASQVNLVKQMCRSVTDRGCDVRPDNALSTGRSTLARAVVVLSSYLSNPVPAPVPSCSHATSLYYFALLCEQTALRVH